MFKKDNLVRLICPPPIMVNYFFKHKFNIIPIYIEYIIYNFYIFEPPAMRWKEMI